MASFMNNGHINVLTRLADDRQGVTLAEFGLLAPVMCLLLMGAFDVGHSLYMRAVLQGAMQKAARDTGLEGGAVVANRTTIDTKVRRQVEPLASNATVSFSRRTFRTFTEASARNPESYDDNNDNDRCDNGEPYTDRNNNGVYDADGGNEGQGGARDAVIYTATVSYPRMFPLSGMLGLSANTTISAKTVLANQPYGEQAAAPSPVVRNCPAS